MRKTPAQRAAELMERLSRPRRILRGRAVREFTARIEADAHDYLVDLCRDRHQAKSAALTQVLREHRDFSRQIEH